MTRVVVLHCFLLFSTVSNFASCFYPARFYRENSFRESPTDFFREFFLRIYPQDEKIEFLRKIAFFYKYVEKPRENTVGDAY